MKFGYNAVRFRKLRNRVVALAAVGAVAVGGFAAAQHFNGSDGASADEGDARFDVSKAIDVSGTAVSHKQQYRGLAYIDREGAQSTKDDEDEALQGLTVYLQWQDGTGYVSPIFKAVTNAEGEYFFNFEGKTYYDALGGAHHFQLAGDSKFKVRSWAENPDPKKYSRVISGDIYRNGAFHNRLQRLNESWNFVAGINVIEFGRIVFQEIPNYDGSMALPNPATGQDKDGNSTPDEQFPFGNDDGAGRWGSVWSDLGHVWWEVGEPEATVAAQYYLNTGAKGDTLASGVYMVASYLNDEVTNTLDAWKKANPKYTRVELAAAQKTAIAAYEAENPGKSAIAETVKAPVNDRGGYYLPFKGTYGNSAAKKGTVTDEMWHTVADNYINDGDLRPWNGTSINQDRRHINGDYMYIYPVVPGYDIAMGPYQLNVWDKPYQVGQVTFGDYMVNGRKASGYSIHNLDYQILLANMVHDITNYDTTEYVANVGSVAQTESYGLAPFRSYDVIWYDQYDREVGRCTTMTDAAGKLASCPFTVKESHFTDPDGKLVSTMIFHSDLYQTGSNEMLLTDSFLAVPFEYPETDAKVGEAASATPDFNGLETADDKGIMPKDATFTLGNLPEGVDADEVSLDPNTGVVTFTPKDGAPNPVTIPVVMTVPTTDVEGQPATVSLTANAVFNIKLDPANPTFDPDTNVVGPDDNNGKCDTTGTIQLPTDKGVVYKVNGEVKTGDVVVPTGQTYTVTAEPAPGYEFSEDTVTSWDVEMPADPECAVDPGFDPDPSDNPDPNDPTDKPDTNVVNPSAGKFQNCVAAPYIIIPDEAGVTYAIDGQETQPGSHDIQYGKNYTVTATVKDGYFLADGADSEWTVKVTRDESCEVVIHDPEFDPRAGLHNPSDSGQCTVNPWIEFPTADSGKVNYSVYVKGAPDQTVQVLNNRADIEYGVTYVVKAEPAVGYKFSGNPVKGWSTDMTMEVRADLNLDLCDDGDGIDPKDDPDDNNDGQPDDPNAPTGGDQQITHGLKLVDSKGAAVSGADPILSDGDNATQKELAVSFARPDGTDGIADFSGVKVWFGDVVNGNEKSWLGNKDYPIVQNFGLTKFAAGEYPVKVAESVDYWAVTKTSQLRDGSTVTLNGNTANQFLTFGYDTDNDNVPDVDDKCVDEPGSAETEGCPVDPIPGDQATETTPTWDNQVTEAGVPVTAPNTGEKLPEGSTVGAYSDKGWTVTTDGDRVTVTPPATATTGDKSTITVYVDYPDGSRDIEHFTVTVLNDDDGNGDPKDDGEQADQITPDWDNAETLPGNPVVVPNDGDEIPAGSEVVPSIDKSGWTVEAIDSDGDGVKDDIKVTPPSDANPGDKGTVTVEVTYPDGSKDVETFTVTVQEPPKWDDTTTKPDTPVVIQNTGGEVPAGSKVCAVSETGTAELAENGDLTVTPKAGTAAGSVINVSICDADGDVIDTVTVTITGDENPPAPANPPVDPNDGYGPKPSIADATDCKVASSVKLPEVQGVVYRAMGKEFQPGETIVFGNLDTEADSVDVEAVLTNGQDWDKQAVVNGWTFNDAGNPVWHYESAGKDASCLDGGEQTIEPAKDVTGGSTKIVSGTTPKLSNTGAQALGVMLAVAGVLLAGGFFLAARRRRE